MNKLFTIIFFISYVAFSYSQGSKASTTKKTFSRQTNVSIEIDANPGIVWGLLTNASDYPRWNSTVTSIEGDIKLGNKIKLRSVLDRKRTFKLKIKEFIPNERMSWGDNKGTRSYIIEKLSANKIRFTMTEKIGGAMFPMYAKYIPSFDESFDKFATDLKREAELIQRK